MRKKTMKVRINLLPWRDKLRKKQRQDFFTLLFMAGLIGAFICGGWAWFASKSAKHQINDINHLQQQITLLTSKTAKLHGIEKRAAQSKKQLEKFNQLLQSRYIPVHLFNAIASSTPKGITLNSIERDKNTLTLQGESKQTTSINTMLTQLKQTPFLKHAKLKEIKILKNRSNAFVISANISTTSDTR